MDLKESERLFQNEDYNLFSEKGRTDPVGSIIRTEHKLDILCLPDHRLAPFLIVFSNSSNRDKFRQSS